MKRLTEQDRRRYARKPDAIPADTQCDRCARRAVARGSDGRRAFALCGHDYMAATAERRAGPRVDAASRAAAIQAAAS